MASPSSFARKLALGFTALGLAVLAVAAVAVMSLLATVRTKDAVAVRHAEQLTAVQELRYLVEHKVAVGRASLITGGANGAALERTRQQVLQQLELLRARLGDAARPVLAHIAELERRHDEALGAVLAAERQAGATLPYADRFLGEVRPSAEALRMAIDELYAYTDELHDAAEAEARALNRRATVLIVSAAVVGLLAAAWLARIMTRRLAVLVHRQRQAWEELHLIVDTLPVSVAHIDAERRYRFVNRAFEEQVGVRREDVLGRAAAEVVPEAMLRPFEPAIARALAGTRVDVELRAPAPDGAPRELEATFVPRRDTDGRVEGLVSLVSDVTAERQARERERFLAQASEILSSSMDIEEGLGRLVTLAVPLCGDFCSAHLLLDGKRERRASGEPPPGGDPAAAVLDTRLAQRGATTLAVPLQARGELLGALGFARAAGSYDDADLTFVEELARRAALAVENVRLYRATGRALAAREELMAVVSHDLRNPLGVVLIKAAQLESALAGDGPAKRHIESLQRAADRIDFLIRTLMDAASIERGKLRLDRARHDAAALAEEAAELVEGLATEKSIRLVVDLPHDVDAARLAVWADRQRVLQLFENLLGNAIKFTPAGGQVTVRVAPQDDATVSFSVTDDGPGIPAAELPRVFERGFQGERKRRKGLGLGLYIARGIVLAHGGHIDAASTPGAGATFTFSLPVFDAAWMSEAAASPDIR